MERQRAIRSTVFILFSRTDDMVLDVIFAVTAAAATEVNDDLGGK